MKETQLAAKRSRLVAKEKDFSIHLCIASSQPEKSLSGDGWCRTKHKKKQEQKTKTKPKKNNNVNVVGT